MDSKGSSQCTVSVRGEFMGSKKMDLEYFSDFPHLKFSPACFEFGAKNLLAKSYF